MHILETIDAIQGSIRDLRRHLTRAPQALRLLVAAAIVAAKSNRCLPLK